MHDALRQRLLRRIESLPDEQIYQVLDYIEFLESKYAEAPPVGATGLQKFAESLEDKMRRKALSPATIREAFQMISAADRVLSGVSSAGRQILSELNSVLEPTGEEGESTPPRAVPGTRQPRADGNPGSSRRPPGSPVGKPGSASRTTTTEEDIGGVGSPGSGTS